MLGYVPKWKVTNRETQEFISGITPESIRKATIREVEELEKGPDSLNIEKMIDRKEKQQTLTVR